jgi:hypothetical protein
VDGYSAPDLALHCGTMVRECIKVRAAAAVTAGGTQLLDTHPSGLLTPTPGIATPPFPPQLPRLHEALLFGPDGGISKPLRDILETYVHDPNFEVRGSGAKRAGADFNRCACSTLSAHSCLTPPSLLSSPVLRARPLHDQVAADAFETLTCVLTTNKPVVFKWLNPDGDAASLTR